MNDADTIVADADARVASRRAASMPRSAIREIMALAAGRPDVIHLEVGEPDFTTPLPIIEAAFDAARSGFTKYSPNAGLPSLRERVAKRVSAAWCKRVAPERIIITTGAIGALYSAIMAVTDPGDEISHSGSRLAELRGHRASRRGEAGAFPSSGTAGLSA